jgi:hypothetical protein
MATPIAVISGDIHYSLANLKLADVSTRMAIAKSNELKVPFIANGDVNDSKANLRAEYVNAMIETFKTADIKPYVNIGNHCKIHCKSIEHSLNFLRPYTHVVELPKYFVELKSYIIPYHDDPDKLRAYIKTLPRGGRLIMHQGLSGANLGDYSHDKSAINHKDVAGFRVIGSHYHQRQTIPLPDGGTWDYIGSPYTVSYGEANDPPKGFQVLYSDGSLEFVPTNLRKHMVIEHDLSHGLTYVNNAEPGDLVWVKLKGSKQQLAQHNKDSVSSILGLTGIPFKLECLTTESLGAPTKQPKLQGAQLVDSLIDSLLNVTEERKLRLKDKWKTLCE